MAITTGIIAGVGALASGGAGVYGAIKSDEFRDQQRDAMKKSQDRQDALDKEASDKATADQADALKKQQLDSARVAAKDRLATTRSASILSSPLATPQPVSGGGGKTLLGM